MVQSIFEVDVAESLAELQKALDEASDQELIQVLKQQLQVLLGLSEVTNLEGFNKIVTTAQKALELVPEEVKTIVSILIIDLNYAREQVLNGDRTEGGKVSTELLALAETETSESATSDIFFELYK